MLKPPRDALEYELAEEGANALGRVAEQLDRAMATLRAFDAAVAATATSAPRARAELVADVADRVWVYVVQREAMGLFNHDRALEIFGVPREIRWRMGPKPRRRC